MRRKVVRQCLYCRPPDLIRRTPLARSATWYVTEKVNRGNSTKSNTHRGVSGLVNLSSDFYDHLALCAPLFDLCQGFRGGLEWKDLVYNGTNSAGIDERAELA